MVWYSVKDYLPESGEEVLVCGKVDGDPFCPENTYYAVCTYFTAGEVVYDEGIYMPIHNIESMTLEEIAVAVAERNARADIEHEIPESGFYAETKGESGRLVWALRECAPNNPLGISHWCYITPPEDD